MLKQQQKKASVGIGMLRTLVVSAISFGLGATLTQQGCFYNANFKGRELAQEQPTHPNSALQSEPICSQENQKISILEEQVSQLKTQPPTVDAQYCREKVFNAKNPPVSDSTIDAICNHPNVYFLIARSYRCYNICEDLADFTGLTMEEVITRMKRMKHFHFEQEHQFWDPQTPTQLAWYYSTSQSYLFANAIHSARRGILGKLKKGIHEPVLDYSGGVGNSVLYLAIEKEMKCQYFGIGMIEKEFTQFRVAKKGLQDMISFIQPWSEQTGHKFDPIKALPRDASLGSILATDVLEHIPNYHIVVKAMVDSLKVGGVIVEETPFADQPVHGSNDTDVRIHVHNGGISMAEAMGERMVYHDTERYWEKIMP